MGSSIAIYANAAIEKVAGAATADVDPIILRQAEIKDFGGRKKLESTQKSARLLRNWRWLCDLLKEEQYSQVSLLSLGSRCFARC